jgi:seryl-tRNA synthetase
MGLDVGHFRSHAWGDPRVVAESQRRRRADLTAVDRVIAVDTEWRALCAALESANQEANEITRQCRRLGGVGDGARERVKALKASTRKLKLEMQAKERCFKELVCQIGNLVHQDSPHGPDADEDDAGLASGWALTPQSTAGSDGGLRALLAARLAACRFAVHEPAGDATALEADAVRCARAVLSVAARPHGSSLSESTAKEAVPHTIHVKPERHAFPCADIAASGSPSACAVECVVLTSGEPSGSWREMEALCALAEDVLGAVALDVEVVDVAAHLLRPEAARTYALCARRADGAAVVVARCSNHVDFVARARNWRQQLTMCRDLRTPDARFVHTLVLSFAPCALLASLGARAQPQAAIGEEAPYGGIATLSLTTD